ncbi:DUF6119 family protein [Flavobacterium sp. FlaQc-47]|uniref:DUF6119 family protein n=1 Tax=Flavobacterium sp. FlaQc-47 TaxID=3374180 RepID=UPI0037582D34
MNLNPKIYKINKRHRSLVNLTETVDICKFIINTAGKSSDINFILKAEDFSYNEDFDNNLKYFLYTFNSEEVESDWKNYFPKFLIKDSNFIQQKLSLVFFIEFEDFLYVIIGGNSFRIIIPFIDESFGIDIYSRILDPENDELLSIKTRSLTGKKAGNYSFYKSNFKLIDHIKFGTIPKEISLKLSNIKNDYFGFLRKTKNEQVQIVVNNSIKFRKRIDFNLLKSLIKEIKYIEEIDKSNYLTTYTKIEDKDLIKKLQERLLNIIVNDIPNILQKKINPRNKFNFEFCHPNLIDKFYEADLFKIYENSGENKYSLFATVIEKNEVYEKVINRAVEKLGSNYTFNDLKFYLFGVKVRSYKTDEKRQLTSASFLMHLNTEFIFDDQPYFLLDNNWYLLQDSFVKDLNNQCARILKNFVAPKNILFKNWNKEVVRKESQYNLLYNDIENYLVFDTITINGIELCDIIYYDESNLYLIHVKYGFDSSIRELYNQVILSARRLQESLVSKEKEYLKRNFRSIQKKNNIKNLSQSEFIKLFSKKINYIMAFTSDNKNEITIENNISKIKSSIAKFSIIQSSSEMRAEYYDLYFAQILR